MTVRKALWAIWCKDAKAFLHEPESRMSYGGKAILVFESKKAACARAAEHYGFDTYAQAKANDWCEIRRIG